VDTHIWSYLDVYALRNKVVVPFLLPAILKNELDNLFEIFAEEFKAELPLWDHAKVVLSYYNVVSFAVFKLITLG
jgi:hypothetical protein